MLFLFSAAVLVLAASAANVATDCGGPDAWINFNKIDITPTPFDILGNLTVIADVETKKTIGNDVKLIVNLKKSNLNGGFKWEVPCTSIGLIGDAALGFTGFIGTCDYANACDFPFLKSWVENNNCPAFFAEYNIPCQCPFKPQKFSTNGEITVDLSEFKDRMPKWLVEGGYEVKVELKDTADNNKLVGCMEMKFDAVVKIDCPPSLKKFGAC